MECISIWCLIRFEKIIKYSECLQTKYSYQRVRVETIRTRYNGSLVVCMIHHSLLFSVSAMSISEQRTKYPYWYANDLEEDIDSAASVGTQRCNIHSSEAVFTVHSPR